MPTHKQATAIYFNLALSYSLYLLLLPLLPLIVLQGKRTRAQALRLPEASGPRSQPHFQPHSQSLPQDAENQALTEKAEKTENTPAIQLLHIGESTVAGVGVKHSSQGFTAHIARHLQQNFNQACDWRYIAQTGIDASELNHLLALARAGYKEVSTSSAKATNASSAQTLSASHLLITLGVNDTTGLTRRQHWQQQLMALVHQVQALNPQLQVFFTQVPPMQRFPALPKPLNLLLGLRAWQLNQSLKLLCAEHNWRFIEMELPLQPQWMAADGYHPNDQGYKLWGESVARALVKG